MLRRVLFGLTLGLAVAASTWVAPATANAAAWRPVSGPIRAGLHLGDAGSAIRTLQGDLWQVGLTPGP